MVPSFLSLTNGRDFFCFYLDKMDTNKKQVLEALIECKGIVTEACRKSGIARSTYYNWLSEDEEFKKEAEDAQEQAIDYVEGKLFSMIEDLDTTAAIFYLKTKGKKRGYVERQEMAVEGQLSVVWKETKTYDTK